MVNQLFLWAIFKVVISKNMLTDFFLCPTGSACDRKAEHIPRISERVGDY